MLDGAKGLNYKFQKISLNRSGRSKTDKISLNHVGSCVDSPKWLKNKKAKINLKNNDNMCFRYTVTAEFNHGDIRKHPGKDKFLHSAKRLEKV